MSSRESQRVEDRSRPYELLLRRSVQALAQPANVRETLFPRFVAVGDELALQFDDALRGFDAHHDSVSEEQRVALKVLDQYLLSLSGLKHAEFWET